MAVILSKVKRAFYPGQSYDNKIEIVPGKNTIDDKHMGHWYLEELVKKGHIEIAGENKPGQQDMTVAQLIEAIKAIKPDFDPKGIKKVDLIEILKSLEADRKAEEKK